MDGNILLWIQENLRVFVLDPLMVGVTHLNDHGYIAIAACLVLLLIHKTRRVGATAALSLILNTLIVNVTIKPMVGRIRPYEVLEGLTILVERQSDFSFPSGHSAAGFAVAMVMFLLLPKRYGVPAVLLALWISLSRLYVGVHYPTDVLMGIAIGSACALLSCWLLRRWNQKNA